MEQIKHFLVNYKGYVSGAIAHDDITSLVIKKWMLTTNLWCRPFVGAIPNWRYLFGPLFFFYVYIILFVGISFDTENIPEFSKYINIMAGIAMCSGKFVFINWKGQEFTDLLNMMNVHNQELRKRGETDPEIRRLRNTHYVNELSFFLGSLCFIVIFIISIYTQSSMADPPELIIRPVSPVPLPEIAGNFTLQLIFQFCVGAYISLLMNSTNLMVGNLYNQIVLHMEVLHHDCQLLDEDNSLTPETFIKALRKLCLDYQSVVGWNERCNKCMKELFVNDVIASMIAIVFSCVEIGIVVNHDVEASYRPLFYCAFIYSMLLYWCWLGMRMEEKSLKLAQSVFIYKEAVSTVPAQKLQLQLIQMVQRPMIISAKPFFVLNFSIFVQVLRISYQFTAVFRNFSEKYNY